MTLARLQGFSDISGGVFCFCVYFSLGFTCGSVHCCCQVESVIFIRFLVQKTHFFHPLGSPSQSGWREFFNLLVSWEVNFNQRVGFEKSVIGPLRCSEVDFLFC